MKISYEFKNHQISTHNKFVKTGFNEKKYTTRRNKMAQLIPVQRNSQGKEEISRESSRHLFIISIRGKQPEAESNKTLSSRKSVYVHTRFHACSPYVTYLHFRTEKEMSVFSSSLVTCAPELCMPHTHPPSLDRYVVRIYRGR